MLYLYQSNLLEKLSSLLAAQLKLSPPDPLEPESILVQSPGMATWLNIELAEYLGISANLTFPLPSTFFWELHRKMVQLPEKSCWSKTSMAWHVFARLPELIQKPECQVLADYLEQHNDDVALFQLAEKIADVFDQYLVFRPDWIDAWSQDKTVAGLPSGQLWQKAVWKDMHDTFRRSFPDDLHRAELMSEAYLHTHLARYKAHLPKRIFLFGISSQPPAQLNALNILSRYMDVHLYVLAPSCEYWANIKSDKQKVIAQLNQPDQADTFLEEQSNPLLASFGRQGKELQYLMLNFFDEYQEVSSFEAPANKALLGRIQHDIYALKDARLKDPLVKGARMEVKAPEDRQVVEQLDMQVHVAHSPMREVEILRDRLLAMFDKNPDLQPKDVLVMMPDVKVYAPFVEAVFASEEGFSIPWAISDQSPLDESPVLNTAMQLLKLTVSRYTSNEVLDLLQVAPFRKRFGIEQDDLDTLRQWVVQANIRWGLDAQQKRSLGLPATEQNTWLHGIKRLLLGCLTGGQHLWDDTASVSGLSLKDTRLLGALCTCLDSLDTLSATLSQKRTPQQWQGTVTDMLTDFFAMDDAWQAEADQLQGALAEFAEAAHKAGVEQAMDVDVLIHWLDSTLGKQGTGQRFLAGAVNFCTLMPMRSIPFKVICLLGMQDEDYPRQEHLSGYDLMRVQRKPGDRSRRDEDRYLFLEALLSCREQLYISYCGRDIKDNSDKPPSVVLADLLDYIHAAYRLPAGTSTGALSAPDGEIEQVMTLAHTLQPFNAAYFRHRDDIAAHPENGQLFSYSSQWADVACAAPVHTGQHTAQTEHHRLPEDDQLEALLEYGITVSDLKAFMDNPCRVYAEKRLGVYLYDSETQLEEEENFGVNGLLNWKLLNDLFNACVDVREPVDPDDAAQVRYQYWKHAGDMPHGAYGEQVLEAAWCAAREHVDKVQARWDSSLPVEPVDIELTCAVSPSHQHKMRQNLSVSGQVVLSARHTQQYLTPSAALTSKKHPRIKTLAKPWIEHILMCAWQGRSTPTQVYAKDAVIVFKPVEQAEAQRILTGWVGLYLDNLIEPLCLMPQTACALLYQQDAEARQQFYGDNHTAASGEAEDVFFSRFYGGADALEQMHTLAENLFGTLAQNMEVSSYD